MTKSELKTGMIVTLRDGSKQTVYLNCVWDIVVGGDCREGVLVDGPNKRWSTLSSFYEDLCHDRYKELDIMKVEKPCHPYSLNSSSYNVEANEILWVREEKKKMTVEEIEQILGYKVEIVSNK